MKAASRSPQQPLVARAQALRTERRTLRAVSVAVRAHSHRLRQRSRALCAGLQVPPAAQFAGVQAAFRRCQRGLRAALPGVEAPPSPVAALAELSHALWCWAVCGRRAAPPPRSAADEAQRAWLEELLAAYAAVERQLHGLMRRPPSQRIAALPQWVADLSRRLDGASHESH